MKRNFIKLLSVTLMLCFLLTTLSYAAPSGAKIPAKVYISGIDVSNMTKEQALRELKNKLDGGLSSAYLRLTYNTTLWRLTYKTMSVSYDYAKAIDAALAIVRNPLPGSNTQATTPSGVTTNSGVSTPSGVTTTGPITIDLPKVNIPLTFNYNQKNITSFLSNLSSKINVAPKNAIMIINGKTFKIVDGKNGVILNSADATNKIINGINTRTKASISLTTLIAPPKYTKDNLLDVKDKLGEYTTKFKASDISRVTNIKIAAGNINNIIVMPNEILSVNKTVGPRIEENGFKLAHVILNDRFVDGIGGGICQVSTTLYNAVLLSDLKVIERNHHSIPSTYVSVGRDATISGDSKDLKFQNTTRYPIYITNVVEGNHITFKIYGKNDFPNRQVKIKTTILSVKQPTTKYVDDPTLPKGKVVVDIIPEPAYTVKSYREIYENGKLQTVENLYTDKYPLITGVKKVGTKQ